MVDIAKVNSITCYHCEKDFNNTEFVITIGLELHSMMTDDKLNSHRFSIVKMGNLTDPVIRFHEKCFNVVAGNEYTFDNLLNDIFPWPEPPL
jgi:hypothetical protein